jgi:hypothetical protein
MRSGYLTCYGLDLLLLLDTFRASKSRKVSTEKYPLSTKSPRNKYWVSGMAAPMLNNSFRS